MRPVDSAANLVNRPIEQPVKKGPQTSLTATVADKVGAGNALRDSFISLRLFSLSSLMISSTSM